MLTDRKSPYCQVVGANNLPLEANRSLSNLGKMTEKVAVVTGSNKGLGLEIVKALCKKLSGGIVYLTARNEQLGSTAVAELEKEGMKPRFHQLDIDSVESIKKFANHLKQTHGGIDILVNNAAIAFKNSATEPFAEQAETTLRVNFFGTLHVCEHLFPLLRKHSRIVHLSSYAGHLSRINGKEPEAETLRKKLASSSLTQEELVNIVNSFVNLTKEGKHLDAGWPGTAYGVSKVFVSALGRVQQRQLDQSRPGEDLVVNAVHPGYLHTEMSSHKGETPASEGARAPVWAALLPPNVTTPRGGYVWEDTTIIDWVTGPLPKKYF